MKSESGFWRCGLKCCVQAGRFAFVFKPAFLCLLVLLAADPVRATIYYIATNGDNNYDGLSPAYTGGTHGPWANFRYLMYNPNTYVSGCTLVSGDVVYVGGGIYDHSQDSTWTALILYGANGTQTSPIVISNYPGQYPVISGSGSNVNTIDIRGSTWVKVFGINETNAYRGVNFDNVANCEIANCDFGGGNTQYGYLAPFTMDNSSQFNWVHNCTVHDALAPPQGDSTHAMTFGQPFSATDLTAYNIIESNVCYHAGHDVMSVYGPFNLVKDNFIHNEAWFWRWDFQTNAAARCMEVGGGLGYGNVIQGNRLQYAGLNSTGGSHGLELDGPGSSIVRGNVFSDNLYSGLTLYGGKFVSSMYWGSNYVYANTLALNGFGPTYVALYDANAVATWTNNETPWKAALTIANSTNNFFVNNLFSGNYADAIAGVGTSAGVGDSRNNAIYSMAAAKYANTNDGGAWSPTLPNFHLAAGSPAIDAGTWLTTVTSTAGSGTSFAVANAGWFFAGMTAAGHTVPGDTIQLQGQPATATITGISGNTITVNSSLTWTNGQGVSLVYSGRAPDAGAFEYQTAQPIPVPPTALLATNNPAQ